MCKYIDTGDELIKIDNFDYIKFYLTNNYLIIEVANVGEMVEKSNVEKMFDLNVIDLDLKFNLDEYVNLEDDVLKDGQIILEKVREKFINFIDSDKKVFNLWENIEYSVEEIKNPYNPIDYLSI
ncbi:TPA: hypothetical protein K8N61_003060 [Clostridium perfringens]|uniref:Uncharacterized protein n=1 Tax=Clostridium perfringens E str. JGS1987 TaxID=451755 RepID=B1BY52_CLOPF|nr:hypothetical protein [Clostridium perfringens]EDT13379.1 conserved hypothetical protein [Clostridium perfringens E str. JGS1987]HBI6911297.1 hypothetical protein [Clostridium perfringens]HBI6922967.1 hypothetical protein [Clostridium perfringens]